MVCYIRGEECRLRVFENRILRRIFGLKREIHRLYRSPNTTFRMITSRRLRCEVHVARREELRRDLKILAGKHTGKDLKNGLGVDRRTMLEYFLKK